MDKLDKIPDFSVSGPVSFRTRYANHFGSFNSIFVYVSPNKPDEFMVQTQIRVSKLNDTTSIKQNEKWFPISKFMPFVQDLQARINNSKQLK